MTRQRRLALIELLRCGADCGNMITAYKRLYGDGAEDPILNQAYILFDEIPDEEIMEFGYSVGLLEVAQRLEEQS